MKQYLMNIAGAVIITVFAEVLLPDKWNKYVKIITGLIIISAIASPVAKKINFDISDFFAESEEYVMEGEAYSDELIRQELENRINEDCQKRLLEEFKTECAVRSEIEINSENEIVKVLRIEIDAKKLEKAAVERIKEIYAPQEVIVNGY